MKARHGEASGDGDGWSTSEGDELDGESENHKAARAAVEATLAKDDFEANTRERLGNLRRGLFDDGDADQAPPQASSDAPPTPRSNPARDIEPRRAQNGAAARRLPSQAPGDASDEDEPLLAKLSPLRAPTKINVPVGVEEESWPTHEPEAEQSPGVPLSAVDDHEHEHEATVVGRASKDIIEMASQEVNTRVFHAPPELIDLAKRKREERNRGRERERDTVKPDPARLLADRKASAANDVKTPVPAVIVTMSDAAPAVASESAPPVARGVVHHVEVARAEEARRLRDSANPRIDIEIGTPESLERAAADWSSPQSSDNPGIDSISALKKTWFTSVIYWAPLVIAGALIVFFVYRMLTQTE